MIIYNVTVKIDLDVHDNWLNWMKSSHIPDVMKTGYFVRHKLFRIIQEDERDGISYSIQYFANSFSDYQDYQNDAAKELQREHSEKYEGKFVAFRTLLRPIE